MFIKLLLLLICYLFVSTAQIISTNPVTSEGQNSYVAINEGDIDAALECRVDLNNVQQITQWSIMRENVESDITDIVLSPSDGTVTQPNDLADNLIITGSLVPDSLTVTYRTNFTILNFTNEFDGATIQCSSSGVMRTFVLGFPVTPSVRNDIGVIVVTEGDSTVGNLTLSGASQPFPPSVSSQWMFEGQNLSTTNTILLDDYVIVFNSILRNYSGQYTLTVTNTVRSATGSFQLDVQFPPEATPAVSSSSIVLTDSTITLIAYIQSTITGNPIPTISWTGPDGQQLNTSGRSNTSTPGQLIISDIITDDNGTYTSIVTNGIGQDLSQSVDLIIAIPAGSPQDVTTSDITDTSVNVSWLPPLFVGVPELSYYIVSFTPALANNVISNSTSLIADGLIPNTWYNITVVAVAIGDNFNMLLGSNSNEISIETMTGAPQFDIVTANRINGTIVIQWTLLHNGGLDTAVDINCQIDSEGGSGLDPLLYESDGYSLMGNATSDPVIAGEVYSCSVNATNNDGTDLRVIDNILITEGLPSVPVVSYQIFVGLIRLTLRVAFSGITDDSFRFVINISNNGSLLRIVVLSVPDYINNQTIVRDVLVPEGGIYDIVIRSRNKFGTSQEEMMFEGLNVTPAGTITTPSFTSSIITTTTNIIIMKVCQEVLLLVL